MYSNCVFDSDGRTRGGETGHRDGQRGGNGRGGSVIAEILSRDPEGQILFVGSVNCLRHKPFFGIAEYMRQGVVSVLCPTMTDFASGRYLRQVKEAVAELSRERGVKRIHLIYSCQWVILSTDGDLLSQEIMEEQGVELVLWDDSHLLYGDHE